MGCACRVTPLRIFIQGLSQVHKIETSSSFLRLRAPTASVAPYRNQLRLTRLLHASRRLDHESSASVVPSPPIAIYAESPAATATEISFAHEDRKESVEPARTVEPMTTVERARTTEPTTSTESVAVSKAAKATEITTNLETATTVEPATADLATTTEPATSQPTTTTDFSTTHELATASEPFEVKESVEGHQEAQVDQPTEGAELFKRKPKYPNSNFKGTGSFQGKDKFQGKPKFQGDGEFGGQYKPKERTPRGEKPYLGDNKFRGDDRFQSKSKFHGKDRFQGDKGRSYRGDKSFVGDNEPQGEDRFKDKPWKSKAYPDNGIKEKPWKKTEDAEDSLPPRRFKAKSTSSEPIVGPSPSEPARDIPAWKIQKQALKEKFPDGWAPRKRLSPDALAGIRALNAQFPDVYTTSTLASRFEVSPENIRRILKGSWQPTPEQEKKRQDRWFKRGMKLWDHKAELGIKPPRKWRLEGIKRDPSYYDKRKGAIQRNRQLEEKDNQEIQARFWKSTSSPRKSGL